MSLTRVPASARKTALGRNAHGQCVLATRDIAAGEVVERFEGREVAYEDVPDEEVVYVISFAPYRWLIPEANGRFLNHSCDPNCVVRGTREVVARRAVAKGEELTIAYDAAELADVLRHPDHYFWDPRWTFRCGCGAPGCRGTIDGYRPE